MGRLEELERRLIESEARLLCCGDGLIAQYQQLRELEQQFGGLGGGTMGGGSAGSVVFQVFSTCNHAVPVPNPVASADIFLGYDPGTGDPVTETRSVTGDDNGVIVWDGSLGFPRLDDYDYARHWTIWPGSTVLRGFGSYAAYANVLALDGTVNKIILPTAASGYCPISCPFPYYGPDIRITDAFGTWQAGTGGTLPNTTGSILGLGTSGPTPMHNGMITTGTYQWYYGLSADLKTLTVRLYSSYWLTINGAYGQQGGVYYPVPGPPSGYGWNAITNGTQSKDKATAQCSPLQYTYDFSGTPLGEAIFQGSSTVVTVHL